ncbi:MAG: type IV secretion system protein, partial [Proteobacteria bacterium]|nr:type IV secretion system protein [Pseudomonadota bacterium]
PNDILTFYKFNSVGSVYRFSAVGIAPEPSEANNNHVDIGETYYKHSKYYTTDPEVDNSAQISKLRLTFKIKDTDIPDCIIESPTLAGLGNPAAVAGANGLITRNALYDSDPANRNQICTPTDLEGECKKQFFCANLYANNSGSYQVTVKSKLDCAKNVTSQCSDIASMVDGVVTPVINIIDGDKAAGEVGEAERIYKLLVNDPTYKLILQLCFITMITFYGVGYLMGVSEFSQSEILTRVIKISIIYLFVSPDGWIWFEKIFVQIFKDSTDYLAFIMASAFDNSTEIQNAIANQDFYDKSILFASVDDVLGLFLSTAVQKKISALLFASIFGWAYVYIIYLGFLLYIYAVANAVLLYLTAQVFISILFVLGPIFFILLLFNQTKDMFDKWLSALIGFSLQQIFLLTTLAFFNMMMEEVIRMSMGFRICWDDVWVINIVTRIKILSWWTISSMPPRTNTQTGVGGFSDATGVPSIFSILYIWLIASLMNKFIGFMTDLASTISSGINASSMASGVAQIAKGVRQQVGEGLDKTWKSTGKHLIRRADQAVFDSGKYAKDARRKNKEQDKSDMMIKTAASKYADAAVKKAKESDLHKFGNDEKAKREYLTKVRNDAMKEKIRNMGGDADKLMSEKGVKFRGHTATGYLAAAASQGFKSGGSVGTSMKDKNVDTTVSQANVKKFMKSSDEASRKEALDKIKRGDIQVKDNLTAGGKVGRAARIIGGIATAGLSEAAIRGNKARKEHGDLKAARESLEETGAIKKLGKMQFARGSKERNMIRDQAAIDRNSAKAIASAMVHDQIADEMEKGGGDLVKREGLRIQNITGRGKWFARHNRKAELKKTTAIQSAGDSYAAKLNSSAEAKQNELANSEAALQSVQAHMEALKQGDQSQSEIPKALRDSVGNRSNWGNMAESEKDAQKLQTQVEQAQKRSYELNQRSEAFSQAQQVFNSAEDKSSSMIKAYEAAIKDPSKVNSFLKNYSKDE